MKKDLAASSGEIDRDIDTSSLTKGDGFAYVISSGRDRIFGDGVFEISEEVAQAAFGNSDRTVVNADIDNYVSVVDGIGEVEDDLSSIQGFVVTEPIEDAGSDDLIIGQAIEIESGSITVSEVVTKHMETDEERAFTTTRTEVAEDLENDILKPLSESSTIPEIQEVFPAELRGDTIGIQPVEVGETMVVRGTTNRHPEEVTIEVEAVEGPDAENLETVTAPEWGEDGVWRAELDIPRDTETGIHTIQTDSGDSIDRVDVKILSEGEIPDRTVSGVPGMTSDVGQLQRQVANLEDRRDELQQRLEDETELISIRSPDEVQPDGEFEFDVTMTGSSVGEVAVESSDFGVDLSVVDADGDSTGRQTETSVEFIDIDEETSTYTLNVDVTGGSEGETGTITAATGGNIGDSGVDQTSSTFTLGAVSASPVEDVSDELWTAVTQDDNEAGLSLADLGNAIQEYQANPSDADVDGASITLSDLGSLIQYYQNQVA